MLDKSSRQLPFMGCIAYRHRQSYLLSQCSTSFIAKLKIHRGRNAATRLFLACSFVVSDVGADRSMLELHIAALSACNLRSLSGNATEIATCVRHLQRLRLWLHFRLRLQPLCCRLPLSATFQAILFAFGTFPDEEHWLTAIAPFILTVQS